MHRKLLAVLVAATLSLTLCGCGKDGGYGSIHTVKTTTPQTENTKAPAEASVFHPQKTALNYEWKCEIIGRAFPCPTLLPGAQKRKRTTTSASDRLITIHISRTLPYIFTLLWKAKRSRISTGFTRPPSHPG